MTRPLLVLTLLACSLSACGDYQTAAPVDEVTSAPLAAPGEER